MSNLGTNTMPSSTKPHIINIPQEAVGHCDSDDEKTITKPSNECGVGSGSSEIENDVKGCNKKEKRSRGSSVSECSVEVDLEGGGGDGDRDGESEIKLCGKVESDCRICHLGLESSGCHESGALIDLGCSCKDDLAVAHKHCAEAWFKIKGNRTCEICGSLARNVTGVNDTELVDQLSDADATTATAAAPPHMHQAEATRSFWQGHRFLNFLLACMVFAFVISWLFHFNIPS